MSSLTPSTGAISVGNIVTSFPSVAAYNLNAYRGRTYYTGNNYQTATFSSVAITMADFYSTADTFTGFTSVTNYSIGTVGYPPNDQNGYAGYLNGRVSFSQTTGIYCTVDAWSADSQTGAGGTYQLATASQILSGKTPQQGYYYNGAAQFLSLIHISEPTRPY